VDDPDDWVFGGKVGLYPLVEETEARRGDRRTGLQRGDIIVKPISITGATFEAVLVDRLLPDIAANCPQSMKSRPITIQLDNASPHKVDWQRFNNKCLELQIDCRLSYQPAQSPDLNICDLSFFPSLQAHYYKIPGVNSIESCIAAVRTAWENYDPKLLNRAFLSLFMNYNMVLQYGGSNNYMVPHMAKERLERAGELPDRIMIEDIPDEIFVDRNDADQHVVDVDENFEDLFDFGLEDDVEEIEK
jgi:hypothetical protein